MSQMATLARHWSILKLSWRDQNERRTRAVGYPVERSKMVSVMLSGLFAGLAGVLYALQNQFAAPSFVFFVVSGLSVNLSEVGLPGLAELCLIMAVAIIGKFGGAFLGGRIAGIRSRQASALAVLMNTRGLTEIVILSVGLQLGILGRPLYSLMIVMAIATTAMAGPLLKLIYPDRLMRAGLVVGCGGKIIQGRTSTELREFV